METQAILRGVHAVADVVAAKPGEISGDRDIEALLALVRVASREVDDLVETIQNEV